VLIAAGLLGWFFLDTWYQNAINTPINAGNQSRIRFEINEGDTAWDIIDNLNEKGLITSKYALYYYIRTHDIGADFKTGTYVLTPDMSPVSIMEKLTNAEAGETWITILEGWDNKQIGEYLASNDVTSVGEFNDCLKNCTFTNEILATKPVENTLEGYLFPDSYIILADTEPQVIIQKLIDNFERKVDPELLNEAVSQGKDFYEILIMGSMIEKEVTSYDDMQIVSGILWKRLREHMTLGVDATVRYARGYWQGEITYDDLQIDSQYNTRKFQGLPPGPICNPSLNSLKAALNPIETDFYYYLTVPGSGQVIYSKTLDEHNENVAKYLR
jgi:UPF0755 protein